VIVPDDPERDIRWFEPVARSIGELVPLVDLETPGSVLLATRGPSRYVGGDDALAERLAQLAADGVARICQGSSTARDMSPLDPADVMSVGGGFGVGIADGRLASTLAARASARSGRSVVVDGGAAATAAFLAPFPVRVLATVGGCDPDVVDLLERLGLRHLGDVAALSVEHLFDRFAATGVAIHRLATGTDDASPRAASPPADLSVVQTFEEPVGQLDPLIFAAKRLVDELSASLQDQSCVCTRILVEAETDHAESTRRVWYRAEGMDAGALLDRVRWQLDGWINADTGPTAGVVLLRLAPTQVRRDSGVQEGFWGGRSRADDNAVRAVTRVLGLLGSDSVTMAHHRGGRDPWQVYELVPFPESRNPESRNPESRNPESRNPESRYHESRYHESQLAAPWPGSLPLPAPALTLHDPESISVLDVDGRLVSVDGRGLVSAAPTTLVRSSRSYRITAWAGPWPVDERWWEARARRSARFQLVIESSDGPKASLVEITAGTWWLTGDYM
jgi:protein ImuB